MKKVVFLPVLALAVLASVSYAADTPISRFNSATPKKANILGTDFYAYKYPEKGANAPTCSICDNHDNLVSDEAAKINYSGVLNGGVAIGLNTGADSTDIVDFSGCSGGLKYSYKGSHGFKINESEEALKSFTSTTDVWATATISLADLGTNKNKISKFAWEFQYYDDEATEKISGSLAIKDFVCAGGVFGGIVAPPEKGDDYYVLEDFDNVQANGRSSKMSNYYWYTYKVGSETEREISYNEEEDDNKFAELTYTLGTTSGDEKTTAAIGVNPSNTAAAYYDFSDCEGFSYMYKGASHVLKSLDIDVTPDKGYDHIYKLEIPASEDWEEQTVSLEKANWAQAPWIPAAQKKDFAANKIFKFAWEVIDDDEAEGSLSIDDFSCLGIDDAPSTIALATSSSATATPSSSSAGTAGTSSSGTTATPSSSSTGTVVGTSSSGTTTTPSSSSTGTVAGNSSSGTTTGGSSSSGTAGSTYAYCIKDGTCLEGPFTLSECVDIIKGSPSNSCSTPIILPKLMHNNALNAMQNAVNLQITGSAVLQIFDLKGNAVRTLKFEQGNYIVPLSDLPHGLYIVKASSASWKQTIKATVR